MFVQVVLKVVFMIICVVIEEFVLSVIYVQLIDMILGVVVIIDDLSGLFDVNYQICGFMNDQIGVMVNGVLVNDSGNYCVYLIEYGDMENMNDIMVFQGYLDVDLVVVGVFGGMIVWFIIDFLYKFSFDIMVLGGSNSYWCVFVCLQIGDIGLLCLWIFYLYNSIDLWCG